MKLFIRVIKYVLVFITFSTTAFAIENDPWSNYLKSVENYFASLQSFYIQKQDSEQIKKLLGYYEATLKDQKDFDKIINLALQMTPLQWSRLLGDATLQAREMYFLAMNSNYEEQKNIKENKLFSPVKLNLEVPAIIRDHQNDFVSTNHGVLYSQKVPQQGGNFRGQHTILVGGGFPFNQTQFVDFNNKISQVADVEFYDSVCTGLTVLYDVVTNEGKGCRPYQAATSKDLLKDEMSFQIAHSLIRSSAPFLGMTLAQIEKALFRLTRLSYHGVTLMDQAITIASLNDQRGYKDGTVYYAGLSYGGFLGAKLGALFPGKYRGLILFSPGIDNPAHIGKNKDINAFLEYSQVHRKSVQSIIHDVAYSPRYDAYRPACLVNNDEEFRNSLQKKMLGELDADLMEDLNRVQDPVYIVTGAKDASIDPQKQIAAMKVILAKNPKKGNYILVPNGGHALWGNPAQSAERAVQRIFEEIEKEEHGAFHPGGIYAWNEANDNFDLLGEGISGLEKASKLIETIRAAQPK